MEGPQAQARRIVLLGRAGTGKTTLGRRISARTGARFICLDEIRRPGWGPDDVPRFRALIAAAHAGEAWVSDGNFAVATFDLRLPRADLVVWVEAPIWVCLWRAVARLARLGEPHRLAELPNVFRFIWNFDRVNRPRIEALLAEHGASVPAITVSSEAQIRALIGRLAGGAA